MKKIMLLPALFLALVHGVAAAQSYPSKPLHIVVPFAAGGAVDTVARIVGQRLSEQMKTPVVIENKPGAGANLGADQVAKSPADGHTLLMGANGLATNLTLYKNLPFDTLRDFAPVARVGYAPLVLVVPASLPARSLKDLVDAAQKQPDRFAYGSAGNGSSGHLATELLKTTAKFEALHVPYKGGAPALTDLVGERLSFMLINPLEALSHVKSQRLRALAVSSEKRIAMLPDTPTFAEAGAPGFAASVWWGLVAPAGTPADIVKRLSDETLRALQEPAVREKLEALGALVAPQNAEAFGAFLKKEIDTWSAVIRKAGIQAD